ncbi:MAG: PA domain-containing protein [Bacteroidota bacterium]
MKSNFTLKQASLTRYLLSAVCLFLSVQLIGQTTFEVTSPANIAGQYDFGIANFGEPLPGFLNPDDEVTGTLMLVSVDTAASPTQACAEINNDLTGMVALIDRGGCEFGSKALNAENAGATAFVICNNEGGDPIDMTGGVDGPNVTIPGLMLSLETCDLIKAELANGVDIRVYYEPELEDDVLWDSGGFANGLGDWEVVGVSGDTALWTYTANGAATGALTGGLAISSPTAANGAMILDADFLTTKGSQANIPSGPPSSYPQYESELISPVIDCSDCDAVMLNFHQYNLPLNGSTTMSYSLDGGTEYSDPITIETENVLTANEQNLVGTEEIRLLLPELNNQGNIRIKFTFNGDFYFWIIDDVRLIRPEAHNLRVMENWWAIPLNIRTPASQVEEFGFVADIYNAGGQAQTNTNLNVTITEASGTVPTFSADFAYGTIGPDSLAENQIFPETFTPEKDLPTTYTMTYTVSADSTDFDETDNSLSVEFRTTDTEYAKETGRTRDLLPVDALWPDGAPHSWSIGNYYYITRSSDNVGGVDIKYEATSATIELSDLSTHAGKNLIVWLYEWVDDNGDQLAQNTERNPAGFNTYEVLGTESVPFRLEIPIFDFNGDPDDPTFAPLKDETEYLLVLQITTDEDDDDFAVEASEEYDYGAAVWRTEQLGVPRYSHVLGIGDEDYYRLAPTDDFGTTNFGHDIVPVIRLNVQPFDITSTSELDEANLVVLTPNPANEVLNANISLVNASDNVSIKLLDLTGKVVHVQEFSNFQQDNLLIDVSTLPSGAYFFHILTDEGQRTRRVMVQH